MSHPLPPLSSETAARLVPPSARADLLEVLRQAVDLLPVAEAVVAACDAAGEKGIEPAKTAGTVVSAYIQMTRRVRRLAIAPALRTRLAQLLEYHSELVGQASLMAYGERTELTERALSTAGLGAPAVELTRLADQLTTSLDLGVRSQEAG